MEVLLSLLVSCRLSFSCRNALCLAFCRHDFMIVPISAGGCFREEEEEEEEEEVVDVLLAYDAGLSGRGGVAAEK